MVDNILENEQHYKKVGEATQERRENQAAAMNTWFWIGVVLAVITTAGLVGTYMARHKPTEARHHNSAQAEHAPAANAE